MSSLTQQHQPAIAPQLTLETIKANPAIVFQADLAFDATEELARAVFSIAEDYANSFKEDYKAASTEELRKQNEALKCDALAVAKKAEARLIALGIDPNAEWEAAATARTQQHETARLPTMAEIIARKQQELAAERQRLRQGQTQEQELEP
jgi:hypothetical protein